MHQNRSASSGLLILRVMVGAVFVVHGGQKLLVTGLPRFAEMLTQLGVPMPPVAAVVVALAECVGGVLLILGLFARPAAAVVAIDMVVAVLTVHLRRGFFNPGGLEYPLTLLAADLALMLLGAGAYSMDGWIHSGRTTSGSSNAAP
jgi:putative oxidoreductase